MANNFGDWGPQPAALSEFMLAELRAGRTNFRLEKEPLSWRDFAAVAVMMGIVFAMALGVMHFWPKPKSEMPRPPANAWMGAAQGARYHGTRHTARHSANPAAKQADEPTDQAPAQGTAASEPASSAATEMQAAPASGDVIVQ